MFCSMIVLSIWVPSRPADPDPVYYPFPGHPNYVYPVYTSNVSPPADKIRPFELNATLRIVIFLLAVPVTSIFENVLFRPARDLFLRTVEFWYDLRYVQPAQVTGSWPDTWTPILNAFRSFQFVADFIDGAVGIEHGGSVQKSQRTSTQVLASAGPRLSHERKRRGTDMPHSNSDLDIDGYSERPAVRKVSSSRRTVLHENRHKADRKRTPTCPDPVVHNEGEE